MKIEEFLQEVAREAAPPSTLRADDIYRAGRRRHRRVRRTHTALLAATLLAMLGVATAAAHTLQAGPFAPASEQDGRLTLPPVSPSAVPTDLPTGLPTSLPTGWPTALPTALPTIDIPPPSMPALDCAELKAKVLGALGTEGYAVESTVDVKCADGVLIVKVTAKAGSVDVAIEVRVRLDNPAEGLAQICVNAQPGSCDTTQLVLP